MERINLTPDLNFSRIVYGTWRLTDDQDTSAVRVRDKLAACLDRGITTIDQADIYGGYMAEEVLGNALQGTNLAQRLEIITKCDIVAPAGRHATARVKHYDTSRAHIHQSVDDSLRLMGIDHIDLLLLHRPDPLIDHQETGAALDALVTAGKVRAIGVSNFRPHDWELLQSAMQHQLVTNQIELSILAHQGFTNGDLAFHQRLGTPVMAWSPLAGGALVDGSHPQLLQLLERTGGDYDVDSTAVAIAWLLAHPAQLIPVIGTNNPARIHACADAFNCPIDRQRWYEIYTAALGREVA